MTYEQSLKNIQTLVDFIRIHDKHFIFFDFSSEDEFKVLFYDTATEIQKIREIVTEKLQKRLPVAQIKLQIMQLLAELKKM